jgi:hypothetical protein
MLGRRFIAADRMSGYANASCGITESVDKLIKCGKFIYTGCGYQYNIDLITRALVAETELDYANDPIQRTKDWQLPTIIARSQLLKDAIALIDDTYFQVVISNAESLGNDHILLSFHKGKMTMRMMPNTCVTYVYGSFTDYLSPLNEASNFQTLYDTFMRGKYSPTGGGDESREERHKLFMSFNSNNLKLDAQCFIADTDGEADSSNDDDISIYRFNDYEEIGHTSWDAFLDSTILLADGWTSHK